MMTAVGFSSIFPFLPLYVGSLGSSTGLSVELLAGLVYSAQAFSMMIASPIWGALADRFGRKIMVERSMFGGAVLLFLMAFVQSAEQLVMLRAVQGLVTGTMAASSALIAASIPRRKIGFAMGMLQVAIGLGIAVGPLIGGAVADFYGYQTSFIITSGLMVLSGTLVLIGVREDFNPPDRAAGIRSSMLTDWKKVLGTQGIPTTFGMRFLSQVGRMMVNPILPLFLLSIMPGNQRLNTFNGLVIGAGSAATTLSAVFLGRLGDRVGHRKVLIPSAIAAGVLYASMALVITGWQLLSLQVLVGIAMGGIMPIISALLANFSISGEEGAVYGLDHSISAGGRALAPLLGAVLAALFSTRATFVACGLIFSFSALFAVVKLPKPEQAKLANIA